MAGDSDIRPVPPGTRTSVESLWDAAREMRVGITIARLREIGGHGLGRMSVQVYLHRWTKAGHLVCVQPTTHVKGRPGGTPAVYEFVGDATDPPNRAAMKRLAMWRAMKVLKTFTYRDIATNASFGDFVINAFSAQAYVKALARAGYLAGRGNARSGKRGALEEFRLVRNTGPHAPSLSTKGWVLDRTTGEAIAIAKKAGEGACDE